MTREAVSVEADRHIREAAAHVERQIDILAGMCRLGGPAVMTGAFLDTVLRSLVEQRLSLALLRHRLPPQRPFVQPPGG